MVYIFPRVNIYLYSLVVMVQEKKSGHMDTTSYSATIFQHDNVKVFSPLSSLYWEIETVYAPGPSPRDPNT